MHQAAEYFQMRLHCENFEKVNSCGPALFAIEPHDVMPFGLFALSDFLGYFPGHKMVGCLASVCFQIPMMRHMYAWLDAASVDKANVEKLISEGKSPTLCPGGIQEVTYLKSSKECILYLKSRKGMIKLAMKYGVPIVPVLSFGQRNAWKCWVPQQKWIHSFGRQVGFLPMIFFGLFGLPLAQPKPCPIDVIVGLPISMPKLETPSEEEIDARHKLFLEAIERMYTSYQDEFGMEGAVLRII
jgi:2-acylglycerol O-acyltransferase 2